jgi:inner membrane protein
VDSITHIALGALIGEAVMHKELGKKAILWGILAQSIPDIDFLAAFWMNTSENLLAHRGFTHSIVFCLLMVALLSIAAFHWHKPHNIRFLKFVFFFFLLVFIHIFIDAFNNYGVGWFEPFSHQRISFNAIYVADPFFSVWPGLAFFALVIMKWWRPGRKKWVWAGLLLSGVYLAYCLVNKYRVDRDVKQILQKQQINYSRYFTTPAPLQNWLWYVVAGNDSGYHVGFRSVFDNKKEISFQYFPRNDSLLFPVRDHEDLQKLIRFSKNFYTAEKWQDTLVFNDLRFGQIIGWQDPHQKFVFHYFLQHPDGNKLVVQRGRFKNWNGGTFKSLVKRIAGN